MSCLEGLRITMKYPSQEDCLCPNRDSNCAPSECRFTLCLLLLLLSYSHLLGSCAISDRWVNEHCGMIVPDERQSILWGNSVILPLCLAKILHELAWEHIFVLRGWQLTAWLMAWRTAFVNIRIFVRCMSVTLDFTCHACILNTLGCVGYIECLRQFWSFRAA
jgi:hypothetical protein